MSEVTDTSQEPEEPAFDEPTFIEGPPIAPPQSIDDKVYEQTRRTLAYRAPGPDGEPVPIIPQPEHQESWDQGARAAIECFIRLVPAGDPTAFALEQLWLYLRAVGDQVNVLTSATAAVRSDTAKLVAKLDEYAAVLPEPDSFAAKLGRWGGSKRRTGARPYQALGNAQMGETPTDA